LTRLAQADAAVEAAPEIETNPPLPILASKTSEGWSMTPPDELRDRLVATQGLLDRSDLAYLGDAVWEYLVLRHQYMQVVRSPFTESPTVRCVRQAKAATHLYLKPDFMTEKEKSVFRWGATSSWVNGSFFEEKMVEQVGIEQYSAAHGLRVLLGWAYLDTRCDDSRLEAMAREMGLFVEVGIEDRLLSKVTSGIFDSKQRPGAQRPRMFFLALAPLGHVVLRLYVSRYFFQRPLRPDEFRARVNLALRAEELELAAGGFMRDDATAEEVQLMTSARSEKDDYAFAFSCLLGHLALTSPLRLHQIIAAFGWARPLPAEYTTA